jgi:hypothetical protein
VSNRKPLVIGSGGQFQQLQAGDALVDGSGAAFLTTASALALTSGHLYVGNGSNVATDVALSGDATLANTGAITVTKTGGAAFGSFATGTDAANLTGTLGSARLSGSYTGITGVGTLTAGTWNATTIAVNRGGTGQTAYTDGQVLIGNTGTGGLSKTTLTAGANITITNGSGTITIAATAPGTGTVTNVSSASADLTVTSPTTTPVLTVVSAPKWTTGRTVGITGDISYTSGSLDGSGNVTGTGTLATVNANVGTFGDATHVGAFTVNAKGLITAASSVAISAGGSGTVTSVIAGAGLSGGTITATGTIAVNHTITPQGRLTLVSATPVMTSDQTAKGTIYYAEQTGNLASVWDGTNMVPLTFSNLSLVLDTTNHLLNNVYDVYLYDSGSSTAVLGASPAWVNTATVTWTSASPGVCTWTAHGLAEGFPVVFTAGTSTPTGITAGTTYFVSKTGLAANSFSVSTTVANAAAGTNVNTSSTGVGTQTATNHTTVRGTGAGTTELQLKNGLQTNKNTITLFNNSASVSIAANKATYLGSFFCTANGQTGMAFQPTGAAGGTNNILGLYNGYNRIRLTARELDSTASWSYGTTTWRAANGNVNNQISYLDGLAQSQPIARFAGLIITSGSNGVIGINFDSTANTPNDAAQVGGSLTQSISTFDSWEPSLGVHRIVAMEVSGTGTYTFTASATSPTRTFYRLELDVDM